MLGVGATLNERFTLERELGQGGMGTVYRATDELLGRTVAIKVLKDSGTVEEVRKIRLEAQILARLVHDKIVRLYDFGDWEGTCFLVMEEVNGPSFANRWPDLLLDDRLRICGQVAEALDYAHFQGVIHRDVKPGNVLLTPSDEAKLSDFGLSLVTDVRGDPSGTIWGTPRYMSPEQAQGKSLDHRTDLYSVGVMLYECVTGEVPFVGHALSVIGQHINAKPPAPRFKNPEISSTLESLILSLLEKHPSKRPASGNLVALALLEEAERARRLQRINPGLRRSDPRNPVVPPLSRTVTVGDRKAEHTPANGTGRVDPGSLVPHDDGPAPVMSGLEVPPSAMPRHSDATGSPPSPPKSSRPRRAAAVGSDNHPVAREMLSTMLASPIVLSPDERYLCGHYLAYLLGGSRRRGIFLRRPLDARNADRARLLLAMTWLSCVGPTEEAIERASVLLDDRPDVRAALSPIVVIKYLASRDTFGKLKRFRQIRKRLQEASAYARTTMLDANGVLNPGMMPRSLDDLAKIAPPRDTLDAHRVSLWNRVMEVWRQEDDFREAVLRYATRSDHLDAVSADLWPEVVYPLIERAHWQRTFRPRHEALWDFVVGKLLHFPVAGVRLDRMMIIAIPLEVAEQLDEDLFAFVDDPRLDEDETIPAEDQGTDEDAASPAESPGTAKRRPFYVGSRIPRDELPSDDDTPRIKVRIPLSPADPFLFTQNILRNLWEEAMDAQDNSPRPRLLHRTIPVGPYELAVIPTGRGRSAEAVRAVLQGMQQGTKQIEVFTPAARASDAAARTVIAIWIYQDASTAVVYLDFQSKERYILWHAPDAQQFNYDSVEELRIRLSTMNLEIPDQLDRILSKKHEPAAAGNRRGSDQWRGP
ncbi:MAG TPA: serine/threonine-protein kinase [Isosphaeraceae bacterium]|nr:serine/threonine-protein kinase [Isosphaeraceae bacterium]